MTQIKIYGSDGIGSKTGLVKVQSFNIKPDKVSCGAAGATAGTLTVDDMARYDFFKLNDVNGSTDQFKLPAAAPLGTSFVLYPETAIEIHTAVVLAEINGTASAGFNSVAKSMYYCTKTAHLLDEWHVVAFAEAGTVTSLTINVSV